VAIMGCGLVTGVSVRLVAPTDGLHLIRKSWFVASDVANLVSRVRLWFVLGTPPSIVNGDSEQDNPSRVSTGCGL